MKSNLLLISLLMLGIGCSKSDPVAVVDIVDEVTDQIGVTPVPTPALPPIKDTFKCAFERVVDDSAISNSVRLKLSRELVDTVLYELRGKEKIGNFWSYLTTPTKQELIYDLNLILAKSPALKTPGLTPFQGVAIFFGQLAKNGQRDRAYMIRGFPGTPNFLFYVSGELITGTLALQGDCKDREEDIAQIALTKPVQASAIVKELYECKTEEDNFTMMNMSESTYFASHIDIEEVANSHVGKKETSSKIQFTVDTHSVDMKFELLKDQYIKVKGLTGYKSKLNIKTQAFDIKTNRTSCQRFFK